MATTSVSATTKVEPYPTVLLPPCTAVPTVQLENLAQANAVRCARAELKRALKAGSVEIEEVIAHPPRFAEVAGLLRDDAADGEIEPRWDWELVGRVFEGGDGRAGLLLVEVHQDRNVDLALRCAARF